MPIPLKKDLCLTFPFLPLQDVAKTWFSSAGSHCRILSGQVELGRLLLTLTRSKPGAWDRAGVGVGGWSCGCLKQ